MHDEPPPWREITTDDYHPRVFPDGKGGTAWIASSQRIKDLLERQHAGEFRLRLVLREAVDLKPGPRVDPTWLWDYDAGPAAIMSVAEIVIQTKDGRRRKEARTVSSAPMAAPEVAARRFARPWSVREMQEAFIIQDASGFSIAHLYFCDDEQRRSSTGRMSRDEARRVAVNMARLPELLQVERARPGEP